MSTSPPNNLSWDLRRLLQALGPLPPSAAAAPVLIVVAGLPGTGKSTLSRTLAARFPSVIVSSDWVRRLLFSRRSYSPEESAVVFRRAHELAEFLLRQHVSVIFDATSLMEAFRESLYALACRAGARLLLVWVEAPEDVVRERLERRAAQPDGDSEAGWEVYLKLLPTVEPVGRPYFRIDTGRGYQESIEDILAALVSAPVSSTGS